MQKLKLIPGCYVLLTLAMAISGLFAQTNLNTTLIGEARTGAFSDVAVAGDYVYAGYKNSIEIFNIHDLSNPGRVTTLPVQSDVQSLSVAGNYLLVLGTSLQVFDLTDPINLKALGTFPFTSTAQFNKIRVFGTKIFICQSQKLSILDFADPNQLQLLSTIEDASWYLTDIAANDSCAFCASQMKGVIILNIMDPHQPKPVGVYDTPGFVNGLALRQNMLYLLDGNVPNAERGLRIVDVSQPQNLQQISFLPTAGDPWMLELSGNYAYISDRPGIRIVDITNPVTPVEVGQDVNARVWVPTPNIVVRTQTIFLKTDAGISIFAFNPPTTITEISDIRGYGPGSGYSVAVRGHFACLADKLEGLRVFNCEDFTYITESNHLDTPGSAAFVVIDSTRAYLADGSAGLRIFDLSVPADLKELGFIDTPGAAAHVAIQGHYAYVADGATGLRIIDITNPANPVEAGFYDSPAKVTASVIIGTTAYLTDYSAGFRIIDLSNPTAPTEVGVFDTPGYASDLVISGNHAYIADGSKGLRILDITNPQSIREVGFFDTAGNATSIKKEGGYVYLADGNEGLRIIDVADVVNPKEVGYYNTPGTASGLMVLGSIVYLADGAAPLKIIRNDLITQVTSRSFEPPADFSLAQNYPNPFNALTCIAYTLQYPAHVRLSIYDLLGRNVALLVNDDQPAGPHQVTWKAHGLSSGLYYYRLEVGGQTVGKFALLLK
ncbi:T9SS type A sorting domain-containing protein [candidate division KSB1 bacterium]|nr:T9SS type A sorting domain-containing protein [candidate division KSB1 bacterium]